ncbi:hypothetical protein [Leptospira idonii]|uniref:Uncharacterized protein n=1 Tax=Leptospira idonii TaxID=1193500 RepID=A0A4R9M324_9LEPT|nr:hypothetical protein [Leptospira idonii]TGN20147.1 hypothetical protein EHS15_05495 [Leptospira idonii]
MRFQKILHTLFLAILAVFINVNIVDDRFVAPLEDLSHQYQSYELEDTTRVFSVHSKKQNKWDVVLHICKTQPCLGITEFFVPDFDSKIFLREILLYFHLINLPPPSLA